jgi:hypothetical protein
MRAAAAIVALAGVMALSALAGCEEDLASGEPPPSAAPTAAAPPAETPNRPTATVGNQPQGALSGAKRAANNTAKKLGDRQKEIEDQIEGDE